MTPATAILVPVLNRPQNVRPLVESIEAHTPEPHRILFLPNDDDFDECAEIRGRWREGDSRPGQDYAPFLDVLTEPPDRRTWPQKINDGFTYTEEPFAFLAADDLTFHDGWLTEAHRVAEGWKVERGMNILGQSFDVVGTNDDCNPRTYDPRAPGFPHSTHSLVRRSYIDDLGGTMDKGPGVVLCEDYTHAYSDDELVQTALHRGVYAHALDCVVEHDNPFCGKAAMDATYQLGLSSEAENARVFSSRRHLWGGYTPRRLRRRQARR